MIPVEICLTNHGVIPMIYPQGLFGMEMEIDLIGIKKKVI
jgi:hypothetical protein